MKKKRKLDGKGIRIRIIVLALSCLFLAGCRGTGTTRESAFVGTDEGEQGQTIGQAGEQTGEHVGGQTTETPNGLNAEGREEALKEIAMSEGLMAEEDPGNLAGALQEACGNVNVRIRAGNLIGSGVIYKSDEDTVWIATAGHVLEQVEGEAEITFRDGYVVQSYAIVRAKEQDVALLLIDRKALLDETTGEDHGKNYRCALVSKEAYDGVQVGDVVIAMGSKSGAGEEAYAGVLLWDYVFSEDFGVYMMVADVLVKPGMSGGGLYDAKGHLLGIICGVAEDGEVAAAPVISFMVMDE